MRDRDNGFLNLVIGSGRIKGTVLFFLKITMPKTLAGFCLFSGISLLVYSIIQGPIGVKDCKLPKLIGAKRIIIGVIGILLIIVSIWLYASGKEGIPVAYPPQ